MSTGMRLPSVKVACSYPLPKDFWLRCVAVVTRETAEMVYFRDLHAINGNGDVVCSCDLDPRKVTVLKVEPLDDESRACLCVDSMAYFRKVVGRLIEKESVT